MSNMNFTCDVCGREVFSCTFVNGMKFCAKCYQETFGETDKDRKIADLETKLKALQNGIIDDETLNMLVKEHKLYKDLEAKLAECEKKAYSRGHSQRDIANEIKLNALREDVANKEKRIVELKQQLEKSEKSKESYRLQNEQHHLQLLQFYSRLGVEAFGADIHEKALETLMIMKEQLAEKDKEISEYIKIVDDLHKQLSDKCDFCDKTKDQDKISFAVEQLEKVKEEMDLRPRGVSKGWKNKEYDTLVEEDVYEVIDNQIKQLKEGK